MINQVAIAGNLTRDAQLKRTASGMPIVSFTVAVNERRKNNQTGEWDNYANYIDVTWFGNYAEKVSGSLEKGTLVFVGGKLRWTQWEREGQKRSKVEVIAENVVPSPKPQGQFTPPQSVMEQPDLYGTDIPF